MRKCIQLSNKVVCNEDTSVWVFFFNHLKCHRQLQVITFLTGVLQLGTHTSNCGVGILAVSYGRLQDIWNLPHLAAVSDTYIFQNKAMGLYSLRHQIILVTVNDQITPVLQPCQKGGNSEGKSLVDKSIQKGLGEAG